MCSFLNIDADLIAGRFHTDPSGTFMKYEAKAIGSGSEAAQSELQDKYHKVLVSYWIQS
jgi:20S proteasome alpha/beta subunit